MDKHSLLRTIEDRHADLLSLIARLPAAAAVQPGVEGHWAARDVVSHLVFWENILAGELRQVAQGQTPRAIDPDEIEPLNYANYERNRFRSMPDLLVDLRRALQTLTINLKRLDPETLSAPCSWTGEDSLAAHIYAEMEHWEAHLDSLHRWAASREAVPSHFLVE